MTLAMPAPATMFAMAAATPALPHLREDIELMAGPRAADGNQSWLIHDPVRNAFFRIGGREFAFLSHWGAGTAEAVSAAVAQHRAIAADPAEVDQLARFLIESELVVLGGAEQKAGWLRRTAAGRRKSLSRLFQQNLFLRVPLVDPDRFLTATMPFARPFFTRGFWLLTACIAALSLLLIGRQWDRFIATFPYFFSLSGFAIYALALTFAKIVHELGHAYAAKRHGLRVPSMGVAFLVLWPVLYTDTTDSWRLPSGRDRFTVAGAGMAAEIGLAAWALLFWCLVPPGPVQSALFALATATWILTVVLNINPLVRFDGYFLLSDAVGIENLQPRAFALLRHTFRTVCLGLSGTDPEPALSDRTRGIMVAYAAAVFVYRISVAIGIGMLLYYFAFKLLGVLALGAVVATMLVQPALREARGFVARGTVLRRPGRLVAFLCFLAAAGGLAITPWQTTITAPAMRKAVAESRIYPPFAGRVTELRASVGAHVAAGMPIAVLDSPEIRFRLARAEMQAESYRHLIERIRFRPDIADQESVAREEMAQAIAEASGFRARLDSLTLRAPFDGIVSSIPDSIRPGAWVTPRDAVALVIDPAAQILTAYVAEDDLPRIAEGAAGRFYPFGSTAPPVAAELVSLGPAAVTVLRDPALASLYGGPIPARQGADGAAVPETGIYEARLRVAAAADGGGRETPGMVRLDGRRHSIAARVWTQVHSILIRESGF